MNQSGVLKPALIAGVIVGVISAVPGLKILNCFCCAWIIAGAILAANLYVKQSVTEVSLGTGVVLGLLTGTIAGAVETLFSIPISIAMRSAGTEIFEQMERVLEQVPNVPAESKEMMRSLARRGFGIVFLIIGGILTIFIYAVVGMVGGAVGVALFEKRKSGDTGVAPPPAYRPPNQFTPPPPPPPPEDPGHGSGGNQTS
jgi:hypothetical protein